MVIFIVFDKTKIEFVDQSMKNYGMNRIHWISTKTFK